jgi:hypothetical protein
MVEREIHSRELPVAGRYLLTVFKLLWWSMDGIAGCL